MEAAATRPAPLGGPPADNHAQLAKAALRRLALDKLDPTPENYARAWRQESGEPAAPPLPAAPPNEGPAIAALIEKIVRGLERGSRGWTAARKKESLQRVLEGSRSDSGRLQQRLSQLVGSWDADTAEVDAARVEPPAVQPSSSEPLPDEPSRSERSSAERSSAKPSSREPSSSEAAPIAPGPTAAAVASSVVPLGAMPPPSSDGDVAPWARAVAALGGTVATALPLARAASAGTLGDSIDTLVRQIVDEGPSPPRVSELEARCEEAGPLLLHRRHLLEQLDLLCAELAASLSELAEDESWARGQCEAMRAKLDDGLSVRGVRAVGELLRDTRARQATLRGERERARESLKGLIGRMLAELDELGTRTGQFHHSVGRYADVIERADSLESLTCIVREMVEESRTVESLVRQTQARLSEEHGKAQGLSRRVVELEGEMQRLSSEVLTDQLTQVANRRGLQQAFDLERDKAAAGGLPLAVGLIDIDNFKRLNDELGHGAGDDALKALAQRVASGLRPGDHVARYGGEEFVVLLPETRVEDGAEILTRLQRSLTGGLFLHESRPIFVTFSAGITAWRVSERIEEALERADRALYAAKRDGKNRTCSA